MACRYLANPGEVFFFVKVTSERRKLSEDTSKKEESFDQ